MVVPPSADGVVSAASTFLLKWLFDSEHEHRQWSAAVSLGLVANYFGVTDREQKFEVIVGLLKVLRNSKSHLVKGACGTGLGYACQNLLTRVEVDDSSTKGRTDRITEVTLFQDTIRTLSLMICELCPSASESLRSLNRSLLLGEDCMYVETTTDLFSENSGNLEEDAWGVAGLVLGLGNSVAAIYRSGSYDAVLELKNLLISWIPHVESSDNRSFFCNDMAELPLCMGSCLALPTVIAFCLRAELMDNHLNIILNRYTSLISALLKSKKSGTLYKNLLMTSCAGAGSFLSCVMNDGVHSMTFDDVKHVMEILRSTYTHQFPPAIHFGGMLGVVNALGAGAGDLMHSLSKPTPWQINQEQESYFIRGPILSSPTCETLSTSMVQEIFLVAKDSNDKHIQRYATWAISFLRHRLLSEESQNVNTSQISLIDSNPSSQSYADDSLVWNLCLWLRDINSHKTGDFMHATTVTTVLRCLSKAPKLPTFDWGAVIRSCLSYEANFMERAPQLIREECVHFSIAHAKNISTLLVFLDELTDLSRFRTLELNMQSALLHHLPELLKIFSGSRMEKLYEDLYEYFNCSSSSFKIYGPYQKSSLRVSFWKGLHQCIKESTHVPLMEKCMEHLFCLLPDLDHNGSSERSRADSMEWLEAIRCLSEARQNWLIGFLKVSNTSLLDGDIHFVQVARRITAMAKLVRNARFPVSELGNLKSCILNARSQGIWWSVLIEVVAAVSSAGVGIQRQWLLDALEISCMAENPLTAMRFVALLLGSCSDYMPLLIIDPITVLSDLPVTFPSLLSDTNWISVAETLTDKLWASMEHICSLSSQLADCAGFSNPLEASMSAFLVHVMHATCISVKKYLPFERQLRLGNLESLVVGNLPLPSLSELACS